MKCITLFLQDLKPGQKNVIQKCMNLYEIWALTLAAFILRVFPLLLFGLAVRHSSILAVLILCVPGARPLIARRAFL